MVILLFVQRLFDASTRTLFAQLLSGWVFLCLTRNLCSATLHKN
jgi:hypothetical protein